MGLLRVIKKEDHNSAKIVQILNTNKQIKFVSLMGIDLGGNATDEKIPVELFKKILMTFYIKEYKQMVQVLNFMRLQL